MMNMLNFKVQDLPMKDLETIGLAADGQLLLNKDDQDALLSGRRTHLLQLRNLEAENIRIKSLDAKLSLQPGTDGKIQLLVHPVYRKAVAPDFLEDFEARQLQQGKIANLLKVTTGGTGRPQELLVEYDADTREFIVSDTEKIVAPEMVNGEIMTAAQKENYRKGKEVQLADDTQFAYTAVDPQGIRANRLALMASILVDGGLTYIVYKGLNALFNQKHNQASETLSAAYKSAVAESKLYSPEGNKPLDRDWPHIESYQR